MVEVIARRPKSTTDFYAAAAARALRCCAAARRSARLIRCGAGAPLAALPASLPATEVLVQALVMLPPRCAPPCVSCSLPKLHSRVGRFRGSDGAGGITGEVDPRGSSDSARPSSWGAAAPSNAARTPTWMPIASGLPRRSYTLKTVGQVSAKQRYDHGNVGAVGWRHWFNRCVHRILRGANR
jgi:hypothetical protein